MTLWRLVFFGLLLMLTLRFQRNGLLFPILERISRGGVAEETVSIREESEEDLEEEVEVDQLEDSPSDSGEESAG